MQYFIGAVISFFICAPVFLLLGITYRKKVAEAEIGSAEQQAKKILEEAIKAAETKKKEALIEAKEEILKTKTEADREIKERRAELSHLEKRVSQKEENLDRKTDLFEKKTETLNRKIKENEAAREEIDNITGRHLETLEKISGYTTDQAKAELIERVEDDTKRELAVRITGLEEQFKEEADRRAKNILTLAIQRCAADHAADATISVVSLPNEEMKGRIIGREGRNIRTLETLTGIDLIIDDTPEAITLSGFDPVRREVARLALEKLISDGRIHPTRIEEMVEKSKREVEAIMKAAGERAVFDTGIHGISGELIKLLGRLKYRTSYGQNILNHSVEVSYLSGIIADELGIDPTLARRAGLLHDIGKAMTQEVEGSHVQIGVDIAKKYKEHREVIHAIEAHHGDVEVRSAVAVIVQAADAVSGARPGARRDDLENYIKRLKKLENIAEEFDGVERAFAIQAGREIRIMVKPDEVGDERMKLISRDIVRKIESELEYPGQIKVHLIRESRIIDYAK